jgi:hypothetical protein
LSPRRSTIRFIVIAFLAVCVVAVIDVTLLGGNGEYRRGMGTSVNVGDCVTILEQRTGCGDSDAWYRVTKERPTSDGCSNGRDRSENRRFCLALVHPIKVKIPKIKLGPFTTPSR